MSKINLTSEAWGELVFQGRNKNYGAYDLRVKSNERHVIATISVAVFLILIMILPSIIESIIPERVVEIENIVTTELSDLADDQEQPKEEIIEVPPPPPLKSTIKFTPPVIKADEEVKDTLGMRAQDEILESKLTVSLMDVQGTDENGADIADVLGDYDLGGKVDDNIYNIASVEQMPEFPGGEAELNKFLSKNMKYPQIAQENGIEGRVYISFVISKSGKIENVEVVRGIDPSCDKEAVRVVKMMPDWSAGKQNGTAVKVKYTLPVVFKLQ